VERRRRDQGDAEDHREQFEDPADHYASGYQLVVGIGRRTDPLYQQEAERSPRSFASPTGRL
jgi:hypothetical protein